MDSLLARASKKGITDKERKALLDEVSKEMSRKGRTPYLAKLLDRLLGQGGREVSSGEE